MILKKLFLAALFFIVVTTSNAQLSWPSSTWNSAQNLTSVMSTSGVEEASGLYWNKVQNRLYLVQNDGNTNWCSFETSTHLPFENDTKRLQRDPYISQDIRMSYYFHKKQNHL